jgi:antirestriction protein ArdC
MSNSTKANEVLQSVVDEIQNGADLPGTLHMTLFRLPADIPMMQWSTGNRVTAALHGTQDARGYRQWQQVGRQVKRGAKAIHILAPKTRKTTTTYTDEHGIEHEQEEYAVVGFRAVAVFRYEDTEGAELPYRNQYVQPADLPLIDVAHAMGIDVHSSFTHHGELGAYNHGSDSIRLCTDDEQTFLHELSHAVDHRLGNLGDDPELNEVTAELAGSALARLYGADPNLKMTRSYIQRHAGTTAGQTIMKAIERVQAIMDYIQHYKPASAGSEQQSYAVATA